MSEKIGFIGLGAMGAPMARCLKAAGYKLVLFDANEVRAEAVAAELEGQVASTPADVARLCKIIILMLPDSPQVEQVCFGPDGIVSDSADRCLIVNCSTMDPDLSRDFARRAGEHGASMLEAPVARGVPGARAGELCYFVGGAEQDLERARPALEAMGTDIRYAGPIGDGMAVKMINNSLSIATTALVCEALSLAKRWGLDRKTLLEQLHECNGDSYTLRLKTGKIEAGDYEPGFSVNLAHKDASIILALAERLGTELPMTALARDVMGKTIEMGLGEKDTGAAYLLYEKPD